MFKMDPNLMGSSGLKIYPHKAHRLPKEQAGLRGFDSGDCFLALALRQDCHLLTILWVPPEPG